MNLLLANCLLDTDPFDTLLVALDLDDYLKRSLRIIYSKICSGITLHILFVITVSRQGFCWQVWLMSI